MHLNKNNLKVIRNEIQAKLNELDLGLKLDLGNCSFNEDNATFKLKVLVNGGKTQEQKDLESIANIYNLDTSKVVNGYQLWGYKTRSPKRPFMITKLGDNLRYIITQKQAEDMFKMEQVND
jgi:hypothetical protein